MNIIEGISLTCVCRKDANVLLHLDGRHETAFCWDCADRVMVKLSKTVPVEEGVVGLAKWRREVRQARLALDCPPSGEKS